MDWKIFFVIFTKLIPRKNFFCIANILVLMVCFFCIFSVRQPRFLQDLSYFEKNFGTVASCGDYFGKAAKREEAEHIRGHPWHVCPPLLEFFEVFFVRPPHPVLRNNCRK